MLRVQVSRTADQSDEPYSQQLDEGLKLLRFSPALESEYRQSLAEEQRAAALACGVLATLIWFGFLIYDLQRLDIINRGINSADIWLLLGGRSLVLMVLVLSLVSIAPLQSRLPLGTLSFANYLLIGLVASLNAVLYVSYGMTSADTALVVVVMATFLPLAMTFHMALIAALVPAIVSTFASLVLLDGPKFSAHLPQIIMLFIAVPVGAVGGYLREYSHRQQFLLHGILSHQALFDPLTDMANRRLFQRHLDTVVAIAARDQEPTVLALIDIDHFKRFNDRFGHAAGDKALRHVADVIADFAKRPMDMATRLGGEEFALLLYGSDMAQAIPILQSLRSRVASLDLPDSAAAYTLTISIGATTMAPAENLDTVYDRADQMLYASKSNGRDRLTTD